MREVADWLHRLCEAGPEEARLECLITAAELRERARHLEREVQAKAA